MKVSDWADEIAKDWELNWGPIFGESHNLGLQKFAENLRKAKADGLREAANTLANCSECKESDHIKKFLYEAAWIEKGEA